MRRTSRSSAAENPAVRIPNMTAAQSSPSAGVPKRFTARKINAGLGREGTLWGKESWDRFIRTRLHFERTVAYIRNNPGKLPIPVYVATALGEKAQPSRTPPGAAT